MQKFFQAPQADIRWGEKHIIPIFPFLWGVGDTNQLLTKKQTATNLNQSGTNGGTHPTEKRDAANHVSPLLVLRQTKYLYFFLEKKIQKSI